MTSTWIHSLYSTCVQGIEPVARTYNTLMIACNGSNQWQECLHVYARMVQAGMTPNTTTYNALISAHSKAGRIEKVSRKVWKVDVGHDDGNV